MARSIIPQSGLPAAGAKAFIGLLANAIFWLVMALVVPVQAFLDTIPGLAPYAHWAPILFYALAFLSFARAVRALQRVAAGRKFASDAGRPSGGADTPADLRSVKAAAPRHGLPTINRKPTVQRMH